MPSNVVSVTVDVKTSTKTPTTIRSVVNYATESSQAWTTTATLASLSATTSRYCNGEGDDKGGERGHSKSDSYDVHYNLMETIKAVWVHIFLQRLVSTTPEIMPDTGQVQLPFVETKQVYEVFETEYPFRILHIGQETTWEWHLCESNWCVTTWGCQQNPSFHHERRACLGSKSNNIVYPPRD